MTAKKYLRLLKVDILSFRPVETHMIYFLLGKNFGRNAKIMSLLTLYYININIKDQIYTNRFHYDGIFEKEQIYRNKTLKDIS